MNPVEIIIKKRDGGELSKEELQEFINSYLGGEIDSSQMTALLMAIYFRGMTISETRDLTELYINSGNQVIFPDEMETVDKHSTGGVGDKISLMLAPLASACGLAIPMISGRGLGHTGGTLDKLESIPGFCTGYSESELKTFVSKSGLAIVSQSDNLVPADRLIYALRDTTGTVESLPLITASILSKKIAEGAKNLVIDLKVGSGAFMGDIRQARKLGNLLKLTGESFGLRVRIIYTNMNSPLGYYSGNALEVKEAIDYLKGNSSPDIDVITKTLAREMLLLCDYELDKKEADLKVQEALSSGRALEKFREMIKQQKGDESVIEEPEKLATATSEIEILSEDSGYIREINSRQIGYALVETGAGRRILADKLDMSAGAYLPLKIGDRIRKGELLGKVYCNDNRKGQKAAERIRRAFTVSRERVEKEALILEMD